MGIVDEDIARVRAASDFVAIASEYMALKRVGRRWVGLCPFHPEKTPSFSVNAEEGLYFCFGCQASGDVITFVREQEHLDFAETVERLAARAGIQLRYDDAATSRDRQRRTKLVEAMEAAVEWYHQRLLSAPDAAPARSYLRSRGYDGDVVRRFRLGWAPDEWDALARSQSLPDDLLRDTGLGFVNRMGRRQDTFRSRVMFPIFDVRGDAVAFGGRALSGDAGPKYKNSPETPIYSKSRILYGLNWAKAEVVSSGEAILCEGYTDVIAFTLSGVPRAIATCGTALAEDHFRTLKNFARRVVLAYDADAAGQAAAERFYEWERRHEVDIYVADLPRGADPADVARGDPDRLKGAVEHARRFLDFRVERVMAAADLRSPEGRARAAEAALAVIREHPNPLVREQYVSEVARRSGVSAEVLARRRTPAPQRVHGGAATKIILPEDAEEEALVLAIQRPEEVAGRLDEVLFSDDAHAGAFRALASATTLRDAIDTADPEASALLQRLAVEDTEAEPADVIARVAEAAAARVVASLEADARRSDDPIEYAPVIGWLKLTMEQLREQPTSVDAAAQLVAWLTNRVEEQA